MCVWEGGGGWVGVWGWVGGGVGVWGWVGVGSLSSSMCIYMKVYFLLALVWLVSFGKCSSQYATVFYGRQALK